MRGTGRINFEREQSVQSEHQTPPPLPLRDSGQFGRRAASVVPSRVSFARTEPTFRPLRADSPQVERSPITMPVFHSPSRSMRGPSIRGSPIRTPNFIQQRPSWYNSPRFQARPTVSASAIGASHPRQQPLRRGIAPRPSVNVHPIGCMCIHCVPRAQIDNPWT